MSGELLRTVQDELLSSQPELCVREMKIAKDLAFISDEESLRQILSFLLTLFAVGATLRLFSIAIVPEAALQKTASGETWPGHFHASLLLRAQGFETGSNTS